MNFNLTTLSNEARYSYDLSSLDGEKLTSGTGSNWRSIVINEQWKLNQLSEEKKISEFDFYKNACRFKKEDLYHKGNLFQFLLMLNLNKKDSKFLFIREGGFSTPTSCMLLGLKECACQHRSEGQELSYDGSGFKEYTNKRVEYENSFFLRMPESLCENKEIPLVFTAIGAGGCLQEWILLSNLILMGFNRLEIHLVDYVSLDAQQKMKEFFEEFPGISASVISHRLIHEFAEKNIVSDIVVAMDWMDKAVKEEDKSKILISERGFFYSTHCQPPLIIEKWSEPHTH